MKEVDFISKEEEKTEDGEQPIKGSSVNLSWFSFFKKKSKPLNSQTESSASSTGRNNIVATDLIQEEVVNYFNWKKNLLVFLVLIVLDCLLVFGAYKLVLFWQEQQESVIQKANTDLKELDNQVVSSEANLKNVELFAKKLDYVKFLLAHHIYWTNFFKFIENNTLSDVLYNSGFSGSTNGNYSFQARTKDFRYLSEQINLLRKNSQVVSVYSGGGSVGKDDLGFSLELNIDPKVFLSQDNK